MEQKLAELQKEVDGFTTEVKISVTACEKIQVKMMESKEYLDMQLTLETHMAKQIQRKLKKQLKDFDPKLLAE